MLKELTIPIEFEIEENKISIDINAVKGALEDAIIHEMVNLAYNDNKKATNPELENINLIKSMELIEK